MIINHYNIQPVYDIYADTDQRDLGGVASEIRKIMEDTEKTLPLETTLTMRGEVQTMSDSFKRLGAGIVFAIILVYLLMVVNFQSWIDPLIILMALPVAFAGVLWVLFLTGTTFNVPSLMGAIMTIGVATANSILIVVFANDERAADKNSAEAALSAGFTRLRPVLYDGAGDDHRHVPDGASVGRGRRTERSTRARGNRWLVAGDARNIICGANHVFVAAPRSTAEFRRRNRQSL